MKIIAFYLPQFHEIPENNKWWGEGFTEWTNVKNAKPQFVGHEQPKIPLNNNYYNLLDDDVKIWQAKIAKEYGVYGFCYYHYWFNGKLLLEKPMEQMLHNKNIDIPFCICWANEAWTKRWTGSSEVLIPQFYGDEKEWIKHYEYFSPFFHDDRYIFENGKPIIVLYKPEIITNLKPMMKCWNELSKKDGFKGLTFMCCIKSVFDLDPCLEYFDYLIEWQPNLIFSKQSLEKRKKRPHFINILMSYRNKILTTFQKISGVDVGNFDPLSLFVDKVYHANDRYINFDVIANISKKMIPFSEKCLPGAYIRLDNSPRYGQYGSGTKGETPEKFYTYMKDEIEKAKYVYKKDMMFFYAWNEWAEGGFIEPEEKYGYQYLEAIKNALKDTDEFPF